MKDSFRGVCLSQFPKRLRMIVIGFTMEFSDEVSFCGPLSRLIANIANLCISLYNRRTAGRKYVFIEAVPQEIRYCLYVTTPVTAYFGPFNYSFHVADTRECITSMHKQSRSVRLDFRLAGSSLRNPVEAIPCTV